ncbi:STAS domain-containing protein [Halodesulfovibrio marinisediminis]|uniref:Anti-sigma factor antagonist n=1 Tax=Halodesulfovibrio marinisediminis DSM 17456 TaxID=1121457 RepID=A0A1N6HAC5_9BACT|nr:STAS domain-containing protein [Halodesulfovibrio marinisediminis]SIO16764.1 anti-sigma B factor antagonist [Halodesulfovibrio marinisediminis DSM 17456]
MALTTIELPNCTVLAMSNRLDGSHTKELETKVEELIGGGNSRLLFDFEELDYINSAGLRVLVMAYQQLHPAGGKVAVCCARDYIQEVFEISGYDQLFGMYSTRDAAVNEF